MGPICSKPNDRVEMEQQPTTIKRKTHDLPTSQQVVQSVKLAKDPSRWVDYANQSLTADEAVKVGQEWCSQMTKLVYGTYSYVENDLTGAVKRFKVVLELQQKKPIELPPAQKMDEVIIKDTSDVLQTDAIETNADAEEPVAEVVAEE